MEWIKTTDKLPEEDELVIVNYLGEATVGKFRGFESWTVLYDIDNYLPIEYEYKVKEWMPLPKVN